MKTTKAEISKNKKRERLDEIKLTPSVTKPKNGLTIVSKIKEFLENHKASTAVKVSGDQKTPDKNQAWSFRKVGNTNNFRVNLLHDSGTAWVLFIDNQNPNTKNACAWDVLVHNNNKSNTNFGSNTNKHSNPPSNSLTFGGKFFAGEGSCVEKFTIESNMVKMTKSRKPEEQLTFLTPNVLGETDPKILMVICECDLYFNIKIKKNVKI